MDTKEEFKEYLKIKKDNISKKILEIWSKKYGVTVSTNYIVGD